MYIDKDDDDECISSLNSEKKREENIKKQV